MGNHSSTGDQIAQQNAAQQAQIGSAVGDINKSFSGFDKNFFNQRYNDYLQFALPQLGDQYRRTGKQLDYQLADRGIQAGGAAQKEKSALGNEYALQQEGVANTAEQGVQNLQQNVQGQKNALISEAESAASPGAVAQSALGTASQFRAPSLAAPIGQAFTDFSNLYLSGQQGSALSPAISQILSGNYGSRYGGAANPLPANK